MEDRPIWQRLKGPIQRCSDHRLVLSALQVFWALVRPCTELASTVPVLILVLMLSPSAAEPSDLEAVISSLKASASSVMLVVLPPSP